MRKNAFYIRYASGASFSASLLAVNGLLTGEMDEKLCVTDKYELPIASGMKLLFTNF